MHKIARFVVNLNYLLVIKIRKVLTMSIIFMIMEYIRD